MSGTKLQQSESHLAEVMWRSEFKGNIFEPFFDTLKAVYHLHGPLTYTYSSPLLDTWATYKYAGNIHDSMQALDTWEVIPNLSNAESEGDIYTSDNPIHESTPISEKTKKSSSTVILSDNQLVTISTLWSKSKTDKYTQERKSNRTTKKNSF